MAAPGLGAMDLYIAEARAVHAVCDSAGVPREWHGEKLSMSQRVELRAVKATQGAKVPAK